MGSDPNQEEYIMSEQEKNTTPAQMKMFLTRIGFGSKVIVTEN